MNIMIIFQKLAIYFQFLKLKYLYFNTNFDLPTDYICGSTDYICGSREFLMMPCSNTLSDPQLTLSRP